MASHRPSMRSVIAGTVAVYIGAVAVGSVYSVAASADESSVVERASAAARAVRVPVDSALILRSRVETERQFEIARQLQAAQYLKAVAEYYRPKTGVNWDGIARCETGGNWSMQGPRFSGGLGFYNGTWTGFGGREFAPNAGMATREQQIVVAERVYARHRLTGWGCRAYG